MPSSQSCRIRFGRISTGTSSDLGEFPLCYPLSQVGSGSPTTYPFPTRVQHSPGLGAGGGRWVYSVFSDCVSSRANIPLTTQLDLFSNLPVKQPPSFRKCNWNCKSNSNQSAKELEQTQMKNRRFLLKKYQGWGRGAGCIVWFIFLHDLSSESHLV